MIRRMLAAVVLLVAGACAGSVTDADDPSFVLSETAEGLGLTRGTSFGMCMGYCTTELALDSASVRLVESSRDPQAHPTRTRSVALSPADRARIRTLVDPVALARLSGVHGCPDCADGGSEWIEIPSASGPVRVTFEHGAVLAPIAALQAELRAVRARFP